MLLYKEAVAYLRFQATGEIFKWLITMAQGAVSDDVAACGGGGGVCVRNGPCETARYLYLLQPIRSLHACFEMPPGVPPVAGVETLMVFYCDNRWR